MAPSAYNPSSVKAEEKTAPPECTAPTQQPTATTAPASAGMTAVNYDPYHTDIYPNNVYSEEYGYDENGKLIAKTITYPCDFSSSDIIWIDGHAYADVLGFGLIEWSGPSKIVEVYDMIPNGNEIGIMG